MAAHLYLFVLPEQAQISHDRDLAKPVLLFVLIVLYTRTANQVADTNQLPFWRLMSLGRG